MERFSDRGSIPLASTTRLSLDAIRVRVLLFVLVFLSRRGHLIAEIRSDGAEPAPISRRHDAAPDSRPGSFFILAFPSRRQAEPAPISRRHDAAPDSRQAEPAPNSRIGFVRGPTACLAVLGLCKNFASLVQAGRLSLHPIHALAWCGAKLPASRCRVCACCGEGAPPRAPGVYAGLVAPADPNAGAPPCTRVTYSPMRKSPKNLPEGVPLWVLPLGGRFAPPAASRNPLDRVSTIKQDRFATLS